MPCVRVAGVSTRCVGGGALETKAPRPIREQKQHVESVTSTASVVWTLWVLPPVNH